MKKLDSSKLQELLTNHPSWKIEQEELEKKFQFKNFSEALAFIVQVGIISETLNHHPHITNVYNKVILRISTHSEKAITIKDTEWVQAIDKIKT